MTRSGRRFATVALALALGVVAAACGDDDGAGEVVPPTTDSDAGAGPVDPSDLPPPGATDLEELYGDALAEHGMVLADRGGLIDRSGGGYVASPTGTHLALYVEPIGADRSVDEYIAGIADIAKVFSDIYDRWPGLESYDVCQEPPDPDGTQGEEPLPVTQIELTRAQFDAIDWDAVTTLDLVRLSILDEPGLTLRVGADLATDPAYQAVVEEAASQT